MGVCVGGGCRGRFVEVLALHACGVGKVNVVISQRSGKVMAGSVLAAGPADAWCKVAPVPVDEPALAGVHCW